MEFKFCNIILNFNQIEAMYQFSINIWNVKSKYKYVGFYNFLTTFLSNFEIHIHICGIKTSDPNEQ